MKKIILVALMAVCLFTSCEKDSEKYQRIETTCASGKLDMGDVYISPFSNDINVQLQLRITGDDFNLNEVITERILTIRFNGVSCEYISGEVKVTDVALNFFTLEFIDFRFMDYTGQEFRCNMVVTLIN